MSLLIKGFDLPKDRTTTIIITTKGCVFTPFGMVEAIEIPPHGRLIDADALMESEFGGEPYKGSVKRVLIQAPTIIPADKESGE